MSMRDKRIFGSGSMIRFNMCRQSTNIDPTTMRMLYWAFLMHVTRWKPLNLRNVGTFCNCLWTVVAVDKLALITDANLGRNLEISITHLLPVVFYLTNCFRS